MAGQVWEVVGGREQGGIIVREGVALTSTQSATRLAAGSRVRELARDGDRLHFERLSGSGPAEGWVSVRVKGKEILVRAQSGGASGSKVPAMSSPPVASPPGAGCWDPDAVLERYKAGELDSQIAECEQLLCELCAGRKTGDVRASGEGIPWDRYVPAADPEGRPKLLLSGDSITHGPPMCVTSPYAWAVAKRNPSLFVENVGWGGATSMALADPRRFKLQVPAPGESGAQYVCILIGTNDAMAMCGPEEWVDEAYANDIGTNAKLPKDWRTSCRPSPELYESSLLSVVRRHKEAGARVAVATPPPLGEDTTEHVPPKANLRRSPHQTLSEMAKIVRRVAAAEECDVLPLFECAVHKLGKLSRPQFPWTPKDFGMRMMSGMVGRKHEEDTGSKPRPLREYGAQNRRPELCFDLVHFSEDGAALYATLVQAWLDSSVAA